MLAPGLGPGERATLTGAPAYGRPISDECRGADVRLALVRRRACAGAAVTCAKRLTKLLRRRAVEGLDDVVAAAAPNLFARLAAACVVIPMPSALRL
jgi:hypothetical protein